MVVPEIGWSVVQSLVSAVGGVPESDAEPQIALKTEYFDEQVAPYKEVTDHSANVSVSE